MCGSLGMGSWGWRSVGKGRKEKRKVTFQVPAEGPALSLGWQDNFHNNPCELRSIFLQMRKYREEMKHPTQVTCHSGAGPTLPNPEPVLFPSMAPCATIKGKRTEDWKADSEFAYFRVLRKADPV